MSAELTKLFTEHTVPMARTLGIELVDVDPDRVVAKVEARAELSTSADAMHGGAIMAVADTLGAIGTVANMPRGARTTTIESKTNFFRAVPVGSTLTAEATPLHKGRTTQVWQTRLTGENGKLAALVTQTQMVLYPEGKLTRRVLFRFDASCPPEPILCPSFRPERLPSFPSFPTEARCFGEAKRVEKSFTRDAGNGQGPARRS